MASLSSMKRLLAALAVAQDAYSASHAAWSRDPSSARVLVFEVRGNSGGLADRLTGMMTALLLAILTDRAFQLDWPQHTAVLSTPRIDVTSLLPSLGRASPSDVRRLTWINGDRQKLAQLTSTDLAALWPERVLRVQSNRGFTQALLGAPEHAAAVAARHLSPSGAQFGCLLNFLFEPTPATLQPQAALASLLGSRTEPVVGVHVRTGDSAFVGSAGGETKQQKAEKGRLLYEQHKFIFEYALRRAHAHTPTARLLLLSDSVALRRHAAAQLGDRVVNPPEENLAVGHVAKGGGDEALRSAVGEFWLFGTADEFVYSSHSGFPRLAASRALLQDAIHTCFHYQGPLYSEQQGVPRPKRECSGPISVFELGVKHAAGL